MPGMVYLLCALTSLACSLLLLRGYRRSRTRLLFWCALCFLLLFVENIVLFIDDLVVPDGDLRPIRRLLGLAAASVLLFGLIWDSNRPPRQ